MEMKKMKKEGKERKGKEGDKGKEREGKCRKKTKDGPHLSFALTPFFALTAPPNF